MPPSLTDVFLILRQGGTPTSVPPTLGPRVPELGKPRYAEAPRMPSLRQASGGDREDLGRVDTMVLPWVLASALRQPRGLELSAVTRTAQIALLLGVPSLLSPGVSGAPGRRVRQGAEEPEVAASGGFCFHAPHRRAEGLKAAQRLPGSTTAPGSGMRSWKRPQPRPSPLASTRRWVLRSARRQTDPGLD